MSKHDNGDVKLSSLQGNAIIALLNLTVGEYSRVDTSIGTKTSVGLAKTIARILDDESFARSVAKGES